MLTAEFNALHRRFNEMDAALQASLDRLSGKVDEVATGLATEAGEIKTGLQSVAQQIRDGQVGDAATQIDSIADRVGTLGTGIGALSDTITLDNATPSAPAAEPVV
jgi:methyl-accepting chemotaxis protein